MTTTSSREIKCSICGCASRYEEIASTNRFGSSDLDTRPPEMERSTIEYWIQCCPECGYCASDVSHAPPQAADIITSDQYRRQLKDPNFPPLANRFLCSSLVHLNAQGHGRAAWSIIHAAWACDDAMVVRAAVECRRKAAELLQGSSGDCSIFESQPGATEAILADLLRRNGQFEKVGQVCQHGLTKSPPSLIQQLLEFQVALARNEDDKCHRLEELPGWKHAIYLTREPAGRRGVRGKHTPTLACRGLRVALDGFASWVNRV